MKQEEENAIKILVIIFLISFSILLSSIYKMQLKGYTFYQHFFYLPIVLSSFWWRRKGIWIAIFLGAFTITMALFPNQPKELFSSIVRAAMFVIVASLVGILSEEKTKALEKEIEFKLKTAHFFFNPIAIAEGFLELAMERANEEVKKDLETTKNAIERIKKVVENVVERGEIKE
ncbi:MAG: HAMP domain-containing histidine kinase [Thermoplasmata archaeon]|jgi:signal transduction histidine kinase|nr:MAG: HAMP domain-containing histidine kinase [Thermoplasmata archaeon]MCD6222662.1 HAMP domain-containing histidine kinase [Thermoplasmata archaeon]